MTTKAGLFGTPDGPERLELEGSATASATITSVELYAGLAARPVPTVQDVGLRVYFPDGQVVDITRRIGGTAGTDPRFAVGDVVPVRYDPADRTKIELDETAMRVRPQPAPPALPAADAQA